MDCDTIGYGQREPSFWLYSEVSIVSSDPISSGADFHSGYSETFTQSDKFMKRKTLFLLFAVAFAGLVIAQAPPVYTAVEAAKHVDETATVTGKVDGIHQLARGQIFLYMDGKDPNQAFTALIPAASAAQFSRLQRYERRMVSISGKIVLYRGKPAIVVTTASQISIK
jgi:hypothetical protein